jgi:hypothetical protein
VASRFSSTHAAFASVLEVLGWPVQSSSRMSDHFRNLCTISGKHSHYTVTTHLTQVAANSCGGNTFFPLKPNHTRKFFAGPSFQYLCHCTLNLSYKMLLTDTCVIWCTLHLPLVQPPTGKQNIWRTLHFQARGTYILKMPRRSLQISCRRNWTFLQANRKWAFIFRRAKRR